LFVILSLYFFFDTFLFFLTFSPASSKDQPDESEKDTLPTWMLSFRFVWASYVGPRPGYTDRLIVVFFSLFGQIPDSTW